MKKFTVLLTVALSATMAFAGQNAKSSHPIASNAVLANNQVFIAVDPCRVYDSRVSQGGPGPLQPGVTRTVSVSGSPCGVPVAAAYSLNFVVTGSPVSASNFFLVAWPATTPRPNASTINFKGGAQVANSAMVPATAGSIDLFTGTTTEVIIDINGYFIDMPAETGDIESVIAGTGLTGGATSGDATVGIADGGVDTLQLADASVTTAKIDTGAVTSNEIFDGTVASGDIADGTIDTIDLKDLSVTDVKMNSGANIAGLALTSNGTGGATWTTAATSLKNSNSVVLTTSLSNICSVNGLGNANAVSINLGSLNGAPGAGAFVNVTPNGVIGSGSPTTVFPTNFPRVATGFIDNTNTNTDCPSNKWTIYTIDGSAMPVGISWSVFGAK
jgi:hypothetical protein